MNLPYLAARIYIAIEHMKSSTRKRSTFDKKANAGTTTCGAGSRTEDAEL
jgi:hypothetical protein